MYVYLVPAVVEPEGLFIRDAAAPVKRDGLHAGCKSDSLLEIEIPGADSAHAIPIHGD